MRKKTVGLTEAFIVDEQVKNVCQFCYEKTVVPAWSKKIVHHLVATIDSEGHLHVHGPLNDKTVVDRIVSGITSEAQKYQTQSKNDGEFYEVKQ